MFGVSPLQFKQIMNKIKKHHALVQGRYVKYVDASFDFRTETFWKIVIRPFGEEREFRCTYDRNEKPMFDEIMDWLEERENANEAK